MSDYAINITITGTSRAGPALSDTAAGVDRIAKAAPAASSGLATFASSLQRVSEFVVGGLIVGGVQKLTSAIAGMAGEALAAYSSYERLGMSLESLVARELRTSSVTEKTVVVGQKVVGWTEKQTEQYNKLASAHALYSAQLPVAQERLQKMIDGGKTSAAVIELERLKVAQLGAKLGETTDAMNSLGTKSNQIVPILKKFTEGGMSMGEALAQAAPQAKELLGWIQKLAIESPLKQEGVANAFRTAMAYGFTTKEAKALTQTMVDFAAATGKGEEVLGLTAYALGQIRTSDKLLTQDLRQLMNAGVDVNAILKRMGYTLQDVGKTSIDSKKFLKEFSIVMEQDFGGAAKKQAGTFSGLLSSMSDIKEVGLREFFAGTFQAIQPLLNNFVSVMSSPTFMTALRGIGTSLGDSFRGILTPLSNVVGLLGKYMEMRAAAQAGGPAGREARQAFGALNLQEELQNAIPFLSKAQAGAMIEAVRGNTGPLFAEIGAAISSAWNTSVVPMLTTMGKNLSNLIFGGGEGEQAAFGATGSVVGGWMGQQITTIITWLHENEAQIHQIAQTLVDGIASTALNLVQFANNILTEVARSLGTKENIEALAGIGAQLADALINGIVAAIARKLPAAIGGALQHPEGNYPGAGIGAAGAGGTPAEVVVPSESSYPTYVPGGLQRGGSFRVPLGHPHEGLLGMRVSAGERVSVTPANQTYNNQKTNVSLQVTDTLAAAYILEAGRRGRLNQITGAM